MRALRAETTSPAGIVLNLEPKYAASDDPADVAAQLRVMFDDHLAVGRLIGHLREQTDDYATPEWGCRSYRLLMTELEDLETDLLRHVHLENHVLMPRFVARS